MMIHQHHYLVDIIIIIVIIIIIIVMIMREPFDFQVPVVLAFSSFPDLSP
jgi:hypothetical protein